MKNFVIVRIANKPDGTIAAPVYSFETEAEAWKEFYRQCAQAVDSTNLMDAVSILTKEGFEMDHRAFPHPAPNNEAEQG